MFKKEGKEVTDSNKERGVCMLKGGGRERGGRGRI